MAEGKKVPDRKPRALAAWETVLREAGTLAGGLPLFAGGKSYGGRMLSLLFAER
ncbi:MAG: dienelactone hydrolase, partial [Bacteroidetes bacterium]